MKRASAFMVALTLLATPAFAQRAVPMTEELKKLHEAKLGEAFLKANAWHTDFDAAKDEAFEKEKLVFVYFSRSYSP